jgi:Concanavalin A-like lectin/glucanases superfamily
MKKLNRFGAVAVVAALLTAPVAAASAVAPSKVLDLELNDRVGATSAVDSSGLHHDGSIGSKVVMNGSFAHFPLNRPDVNLGAAPLIKVPDATDGSLDPGTGAFTVEMRLRTTYGENIFQKGQATTTGGQWKMEMQGGKFTCGLKTSGGNAVVNSGTVKVQDGSWHTIRCERAASSLALYVDGKRTGHSTNKTGDLNNSYPWSLGGKPTCNGTPVSCDYFNGDIDYVRVTKG